LRYEIQEMELRGKANELYNEFEAMFATLTDDEVVSKFNRQVGNKGWTSAKVLYLTAIRDEFDVRKFDYSEIGEGPLHVLSLTNLINLLL